MTLWVFATIETKKFLLNFIARTTTTHMTTTSHGPLKGTSAPLTT
jgi:hypothetical protein